MIIVKKRKRERDKSYTHTQYTHTHTHMDEINLRKSVHGIHILSVIKKNF